MKLSYIDKLDRFIAVCLFSMAFSPFCYSQRGAQGWEYDYDFGSADISFEFLVRGLVVLAFTYFLSWAVILCTKIIIDGLRFELDKLEKSIIYILLALLVLYLSFNDDYGFIYSCSLVAVFSFIAFLASKINDFYQAEESFKRSALKEVGKTKYITIRLQTLKKRRLKFALFIFIGFSISIGQFIVIFFPFDPFDVIEAKYKAWMFWIGISGITIPLLTGIPSKMIAEEQMLKTQSKKVTKNKTDTHASQYEKVMPLPKETGSYSSASSSETRRKKHEVIARTQRDLNKDK